MTEDEAAGATGEAPAGDGEALAGGAGPAAGGHGPAAEAGASAWRDAVCDALCVPFAAGAVTCNPVNGFRVPGSVGLPLPGVAARVVDDAGFPVALRTPGLLELKAPNLAVPGRWVRTRMRAQLDEAGYVYLESTRAGGGSDTVTMGASERRRARPARGASGRGEQRAAST